MILRERSANRIDSSLPKTNRDRPRENSVLNRFGNILCPTDKDEENQAPKQRKHTALKVNNSALNIQVKMLAASNNAKDKPTKKAQKSSTTLLKKNPDRKEQIQDDSDNDVENQPPKKQRKSKVLAKQVIALNTNKKNLNPKPILQLKTNNTSGNIDLTCKVPEKEQTSVYNSDTAKLQKNDEQNQESIEPIKKGNQSCLATTRSRRIIKVKKPDKDMIQEQSFIERSILSGNMMTSTPLQTRRKQNADKKSPLLTPVEKITNTTLSSKSKENKPPNKKLQKKQNRKSQTSSKNKEDSSKQQGKQRIININYSYRVLQDKTSPNKENEPNAAVYDFTYDPNEEPPQKKKRKQTVRKKAKPKPKAVFLNDNYSKSMSKKLDKLKEVMRSKGKTVTVVDQPEIIQAEIVLDPVPEAIEICAVPDVNTSGNSKENQLVADVPSIIAEFDENQINYSPVPAENSQQIMPKRSAVNETRDLLRVTRARSIFPQVIQTHDNDPLNLMPEHSFDEAPIASSSMNLSARQPPASPWRPDFSDLPIKWQQNSYIKPNMTPAVETSFVISAEKKKHVYTNIGLEHNESLPDLFGEENHGTAGQMKQTSILDFIREKTQECLKRKMKIKKKKEGSGPSRANIPLSALNVGPSTEVVKQMLNDMQTANIAAQVHEDNVERGENRAVSRESLDINEDSESVHLFEDIEIIHHNKPTRKSYGRPNKVTFCQNVISDTAAAAEHEDDEDSDDEDFEDTTFRLPCAKTKRAAKKKKTTKFTKKEKEEAEAWAAAFNSMCEEVEDFPLVVE